MARLTFFIGKGGVGKTTVSSAYALHRAAHPRGKGRKKPVILVSTDPAHSLEDVFQRKLGNSVRNIGGLRVWQIDAQKQFDRFMKDVRGPLLELMEQGTFFTKEEVEPFLDSTLPGMAEVSALLTIAELVESGKYSEIVVDTAPLGHTLRLFQIPDAFLKVLEFFDVAASRDQVLAETFGGRRSESPSQRFLQRWNDSLARMNQVLESEDTSLTLVTSAEPFSLQEAVRASHELKKGPLKLELERVVLNRVVLKAGACELCKAREGQAKAAKSFIGKHFRGVELLTGEDPGGPVLGAEPLRAFGAHVFLGDALRLRPKAPATRGIVMDETEWPVLQSALHFTLGKGGVGKTTVSAGLAFHERKQKKSEEVLICSTDPAPSLDDIFLGHVGDEAIAVLGDKRLLAMEVDSAQEYRNWARRLRDQIEQSLHVEQKGVHIEFSYELRLIEALMDIVPPGVDEVFAILRLTDLIAAKRKIVIDMAPTGHALELLRTPERLMQWSRMLLKSLAGHRNLAAARDLAVEVAMISQKVRELLALMAARKQTEVSVVMLAEPMPDRETRRLVSELHALNLSPTNLFVNRLLLEEDAKGCRRCDGLRRWQQATLAGLGARFPATPVYLVRNFQRPVAGEKGLARLTEDLWRLAKQERRQGAKPNRLRKSAHAASRRRSRRSPQGSSSPRR
jgi:arsenite-transporting ATPase